MNKSACVNCGTPISPHALRCRRCLRRHMQRREIEDLIEMRLSGMTYQAIAAKIGVTRERARQLLLWRWRSDRRNLSPIRFSQGGRRQRSEYFSPGGGLMVMLGIDVS